MIVIDDSWVLTQSVLFQMDSLVGDRDEATNQVGLFDRSYKGSTRKLEIGDGDIYKIPVDGFISSWQYYSDDAGEAAFQVWRPRADLGQYM